MPVFGIFFDQGIWRYLFIAAAVVMAEKIGFTKLDVQKSAFSIGECTSTVVRSCGRPTHSKVDSLYGKTRLLFVYHSKLDVYSQWALGPLRNSKE